MSNSPIPVKLDGSVDTAGLSLVIGAAGPNVPPLDAYSRSSHQYNGSKYPVENMTPSLPFS